MDAKLRKAREKAGWRFGTVQEFLGLSDEEAAYIEMRVALSRALREKRKEKRVTQKELAERIGSKQPSVARMEAGQEGTLDLLVRSMLALGASPKEIGRKLASNLRTKKAS